MVHHEAIEIRMLGLEDGAAVARLAQLDTADAPPSPVLGAIVDGRLVAAHSVATGESVADPFRHTAQIRSLLKQRARQVRGGGRRGLLSRLRGGLGGEIAFPPERTSEALR
jgi:hypothetical protein